MSQSTLQLNSQNAYARFVFWENSTLEGKWMQNDLELDCAEFGQGQIFDRNANVPCRDDVHCKRVIGIL